MIEQTKIEPQDQSAKNKEVWALYLPQFYETKENNEWWGKGFTEWTNVRRAKPLFNGHIQPLVPLKSDYYDLSDVTVMRRQAELAQQYGISCFVVFHYWYMGRLLLEKPMETLLASTDVDFPFCFCWANHSWTRAWDGKDHEMLVEQKYGEQDEWEAHLQYLLPFFKDKRYRKIGGKPVLFIYKAAGIEQGNERIEYWDRRLQEEGFAGLYIVEYINTFNKKTSLVKSQAVFEDEPNYTARFQISLPEKGLRWLHKKTKTIDKQSFDRLWDLIIKNRRCYAGRKIFSGAFALWDNSPRKGRNSRVVVGATPNKFKDRLTELLSRNRADDSGIVIFNAWNEWGEGAILEATEQYGYSLLEAVRSSLRTVNSAAAFK